MMLKGPGRHPYDYPGVGDPVPSALIQEEQNLGWDTPPIGIDGGRMIWGVGYCSRRHWSEAI